MRRMSRTGLTPLATAGITLLLGACSPNDIARADLAAVVDRDVVAFSNDALPEPLLTRLASSRVVVFGELHQNSDHYAFLSALVVALHSHGVRQLLMEFPHAWDWTLIVAVEEGSVPGWERRNPNIGGALIDAVCRFNAGLPKDERIRVRAFDANQPGYGGAKDFASAFASLAARLPEGDALAAPLASYPGEPDERRLATLEALRASIVGDRSRYEALWGAGWLEVVLETLEIERASVPIRRLWADQEDLAIDLREDVMKELCDRRIREVTGKTVINTGLNHAQKQRLRGTSQEWLSDYLVHRSPVAAGMTETVAVVPARGEAYVSGKVSTFDLTQTSPDDELLRLMGESTGWSPAFLALDDPLFDRDQIPINFHDEVRVCAPKRHFDAFVLLPESHLIVRQ